MLHWEKKGKKKDRPHLWAGIHSWCLFGGYCEGTQTFPLKESHRKVNVRHRLWSATATWVRGAPSRSSDKLRLCFVSMQEPRRSSRKGPCHVNRTQQDYKKKKQQQNKQYSGTMSVCTWDQTDTYWPHLGTGRSTPVAWDEQSWGHGLTVHHRHISPAPWFTPRRMWRVKLIIPHGHNTATILPAWDLNRKWRNDKLIEVPAKYHRESCIKSEKAIC